MSDSATESVPRQVDKKSRVPEEETGVWNSQGGGKDKLFFFLHSLVRIYTIMHPA